MVADAVAPGVSFYLTTNDQLSLTCQRVSGQGRVVPRLALEIEARYLPDPRQSEPREMEVRTLHADLLVNGELIGRGEMHAAVPPISAHNDGHLHIEVPISAAATRFVDETTRGDDVRLVVTLHAAIRYRRPAQSVGDGAGGQRIEGPGPWQDMPSTGIPSLEVDIPRGEWVRKVLEPIGTDRYVWMEFAIPPAPAGERWMAALEHLSKAEARYHQGDDADVLGCCWDAVEALAPGQGGKIVPDVAAEAKRRAVDDQLIKFRAFLQGGRHPSELTPGSGGRYHVDHRDAAFALAQTKVWLTYLAHLEA